MPGEDEGRFDHFMTEQYMPFVDRFDKHLAEDDRRFDMMTAAVQRISTSLEVQASVGQALIKQGDKIFKKSNAVLLLVAALLGPCVAIGIAIFKP